jgi:hypothetical protein
VIATPSGLLVRATPVRSIDAGLRHRMCEKLIRGLHYKETGETLGSLQVQAKLLINEAPPPELREIIAILARTPTNDTLGPGLRYRRIHASRISCWSFLVWGQVTFVAFAKHASAK